MPGRSDPARNVGAASHKLVLPTSANNVREYFEDDCSPYLEETEVEEMQRDHQPGKTLVQ